MKGDVMDKPQRHYQGHLVIPRPKQLQESERWVIDLFVEWFDVHQGNIKKYRAKEDQESYKTEEEAIEHCFKLGEQIIDDNVQGYNFENY
jgi:hypothetical protein